MLLSHYEILACGTALWKLLDLTVFAQGLLINSPFEWWSVSRADSTCHWWERDRERQRERERKVDWTKEATTALWLFTEDVNPVCCFRDSLSSSLPLWLDGATTPHHPTAPSILPCCSLHLCSLPLTPASSPLPPHLQSRWGSVGFLVLTTHFPDLVQWPWPQYTQWL